MENASKALLMAGGILLTMLVVALIAYAWNMFSDFYSNQDELAEITDLSEFNLQFTNYDRDDVSGYEIVSLANKVVDYNQRYSNVGKNDEKYTPVTLVINFPIEDGEDTREKLKYDDEYRLFKRNQYTQSDTINMIQPIIANCTAIEAMYGGTNEASKIAKSFAALVLTQEQLDYNKNTRGIDYKESYISALDLYNSIVKDKITYTKTDSEETIKNGPYKEMTNKITTQGNILAYYEYYQFKKGIFKCNGQIEYDEVSGRVSKITFDFTGKIE